MNKLLLVDDEPIILRGMRKLVDFATLGMEVVGEAYDGRQALEMIERLNPDVVMTDIWMPAMDGVELMREIRARGFSARVIVLSGYSDFAYAKQAIVCGAMDYLLKPVGVGELSAALQRAAQSIAEERNQKAPHVDEAKSAVEHIRAYIASNFAEDLNLVRLAGMVYMNPTYVSALFRKRYGETLKDFIARVRMEQAAQMLMEGHLKSYEISERVGYNNVRHFNFVFKNYYGVSPTEYRGRASRGDL